MRKLLMLCVTTLIVALPSFAQQGNQVIPSAGLQFVAALPATCTPGGTASVQLSVAPYLVYYCSAVNTWTAVGAINGTILAPQIAFGTGLATIGGSPNLYWGTNSHSNNYLYSGPPIANFLNTGGDILPPTVINFANNFMNISSSGLSAGIQIADQENTNIGGDGEAIWSYVETAAGGLGWENQIYLNNSTSVGTDLDLGIDNQIVYAGSGSVGDVRGVQVAIANSGMGTITDSFAFYAASAGGTNASGFTNRTGLYIDGLNGNATNSYAVRIKDQSAGATNYGIYEDGSNTKNLLSQLSLSGTSVPFTNSTAAATTAYADSNFKGVGVTGFRDDFLNASLPMAAVTNMATTTILTTAQYPVPGETMWWAEGIGATASWSTDAGTFTNPGQTDLVTGALSGDGAVLYKSYSGAATFGALGSNAGWEANFILNGDSSTNDAFRVGFCVGGGQQSDPPTAGIYAEFDTANTGNTDTDITLVTRSSSTSSYAASAVAPGTTFHHVRLRSTTAGTILMQVDGGTEVSLAINVPTVGLMMFVQKITRESFAHKMRLDFASYEAATGRS